MLNEAGKIWAYNLQNRVFILGRYETPTGGCDGIKTQDEVCDGIRKLSKLGSVVFEGAQLSSMYGRYVLLERELMPTHHWIWAVMDTPLDKCIQNILKRREAKGNTKPFDPQKTVAGKHRAATVTTREALEKHGCDVRTLCYQYTLASLLDWLGERPLIYRMADVSAPVCVPVDYQGKALLTEPWLGEK